MVVDRLEILGLDAEAVEARIGGQALRDAAHQVLDEPRVVVRAFGHVLLVGALQDAVELARRLFLGDPQELVHEHRRVAAHGDRHRRALVVRAVLGDFLRARAQRRHRHRDGDGAHVPAFGELGGEPDLVVEQARDAGDRRRLADEERERELDLPARRIQPHDQVLERTCAARPPKAAARPAPPAPPAASRAATCACPCGLPAARRRRWRRRSFPARRRRGRRTRADSAVRGCRPGRSRAGARPSRTARRESASAGRVARVGSWRSRRDCNGCSRRVRSRGGLRPRLRRPRVETGGDRGRDALGVEPDCASRNAGSPWSTKWSGRPRCRIGTAMPAAASTSATPLPAPPAMTFSSTVTTRSCSRASLHDEVDVERLHEAHVGDRRVELLRRLQRRLQHRPEREDRDAMRAARRRPPHLAAADRQRVHLGVDRDAGSGAARIAHRRRRAQRARRVEHLPALVLVGRRHHRRVRQAAQVARGRTRRCASRRPRRRSRRGRSRTPRAGSAARRRGSAGRTRAAGTSNRWRRPAACPRTPGRRRTSPRAARRCRRRSSARETAARSARAPSLRASRA